MTNKCEMRGQNIRWSKLDVSPQERRSRPFKCKCGKILKLLPDPNYPEIYGKIPNHNKP